MLTPFIGFFATAISVISFLPQVIYSWKSKSLKDLSLPSYLLIATGSVFWFTYGLMRTDAPVMLANGIIGMLVFSIIFLKFKYRQ